MDTTFKDDDLMWRAVTGKGLQDAAYVVIIVWETVAALVLGYGTWLWVRRDDDRAAVSRRTGCSCSWCCSGPGSSRSAVSGSRCGSRRTGTGWRRRPRVFLLSGVVLVVVQLTAGRAERSAT